MHILIDKLGLWNAGSCLHSGTGLSDKPPSGSFCSVIIISEWKMTDAWRMGRKTTRVQADLNKCYESFPVPCPSFSFPLTIYTNLKHPRLNPKRMRKSTGRERRKFIIVSLVISKDFSVRESNPLLRLGVNTNTEQRTQRQHARAQGDLAYSGGRFRSMFT